MANYNCIYCGYATKAAVKPKKCPYCSRDNAMVQEESAEKLIEEA
jgi:rubrerythrin